jgi:hypothetical protein
MLLHVLCCMLLWLLDFCLARSNRQTDSSQGPTVLLLLFKSKKQVQATALPLLRGMRDLQRYFCID